MNCCNSWYGQIISLLLIVLKFDKYVFHKRLKVEFETSHWESAGIIKILFICWFIYVFICPFLCLELIANETRSLVSAQTDFNMIGYFDAENFVIIHQYVFWNGKQMSPPSAKRAPVWIMIKNMITSQDTDNSDAYLTRVRYSFNKTIMEYRIKIVEVEQKASLICRNK
jgi:hypothetical protein